MVGTVVVTLCTHHLSTICIKIPNSLYIPDLPCNLISPQWLISELQKQHKKASFHIFPHGCLLLIDAHIIPLKYHLTSNLPTFTPFNDMMTQHMLPSHQVIFHNPEETQLLYGLVAHNQSLSFLIVLFKTKKTCYL